ncbi:MAG: hypothetical protein ABFS17_05660, partial [Chloroflexota bacterium]
MNNKQAWDKIHTLRAHTNTSDTISYDDLASDHLSSASLVMNTSGTPVSQQRYLPFGEAQTIDGTNMEFGCAKLRREPQARTETDLTYTGQRSY